MSGRYAPRLNVALMTITAVNAAGSISSTAVAKEETAQNADTLKSGGTNGCVSVNGAACPFLKNSFYLFRLLSKSKNSGRVTQALPFF